MKNKIDSLLWHRKRKWTVQDKEKTRTRNRSDGRLYYYPQKKDIDPAKWDIIPSELVFCLYDMDFCLNRWGDCPCNPYFILDEWEKRLNEWD